MTPTLAHSLPAIAKLADVAPNLDLRVVGRDAQPDLIDSHMTGQRRSIPVVLRLDAKVAECAWWGRRPAPLKQWVREERQALSKEERYRESRRGVTECVCTCRSRKRSTPSLPR